MAVPHRQCLPYRLLAPPRARSASPARRTLPVHACASAHLPHDADHPRHAQHIKAAAPHRPHLPARCHRLQRISTLRSKLAPAGHPKDYVGHHRSTQQQVRRAFLVPHARHLHRLSAHGANPAGLRSKFRPPAHRERDMTPMHLDAPRFERVHPKYSGSKCGRRSPTLRRLHRLPAPPRPSSAPTPASARTLDLPRTTNATWQIASPMHLDSISKIKHVWLVWRQTNQTHHTARILSGSILTCISP
ncbi:hypothetical protein B0H19DRAFT_1276663 [Mycena capillaripes]|nr:hypothetical protein B0H19DRAFT_1276663 [Mycena capillaripes]